MTALNKIADLLRTGDSLVILMHEQPDGDTVACSLALASALEQLGKQVDCVSRDPIPKPFRFLPGIDQVKADFLAGDYDYMILLDCGDLKRTGFPERVRQFARQRRRVIHIDHHQKSDLYKLANYRLFDSDASATSQVLYPLFQTLGVRITPDIATALLTSLYYDTGAFKHANTTDRVLALAAQLLHLGARLKQITRHVDLTKSVASLRLWGIALKRARLHRRLRIISTVLTQRDLMLCGANQSDVAGIVNLLNAVPESRAALLVSETSYGQLRGSLRTEERNIDVAALATLFGGGGLRRASGFALGGYITITGSGKWKIILSGNA